MSDPAVTPPAPPAPPAPWYAARNDSDFTGYLQNRGLDKKTPDEAAFETYKAHSEATQMISRLSGTPDKDRIIIKPKPDAPEAEWTAYHQKNGKPADAKDYDFANLKYADGDVPDESLRNTLTNAAFRNHLSKEQASGVAKDMLDWIAKAAESEALQAEADRSAAEQALRKSWGGNYDSNMWAADSAFKKAMAWAKLTPDQVSKASQAMASTMGKAEAMQFFLSLYHATTEDKFVNGRAPGPLNPTTREGAADMLRQLKQDADWVKRFNNGDLKARQEFDALTARMAGIQQAA